RTLREGSVDVTRIRRAAGAALLGALVLGGLVVAPAASAAITGSHITTPADPSFFVADEDAATQTFAISGTTTGGNPASDMVDVRCYYGGTSVRVVHNVRSTQTARSRFPQPTSMGLSISLAGFGPCPQARTPSTCRRSLGPLSASANAGPPSLAVA